MVTLRSTQFNLIEKMEDFTIIYLFIYLFIVEVWGSS